MEVENKNKIRLLLPLVLGIMIFIIFIALLGFAITSLFKLIETDEGSYYVLKGTNIELVPHVISIIIISFFLLILMFYINRKIKKANPLSKPKGILLVVEILVSTIDNFMIDIGGKKLSNLSAYIGLLAIYLFTANIFGLLGFTPPPTSNLTVTFSFGLTTFLLVRYYGVKSHGLEHFSGLFKPLPLTPINIIGEIAVPFTLSIRLFGNILSGVVIMTLVYTAVGLGFNSLVTFIFNNNLGGIGELLTPFVGVPFLHIYFDLFSGLIQTFVFILLTSVFISNASN